MRTHLIKIIFLACPKSKTIVDANQQVVKSKSCSLWEQLIKIIKLKQTKTTFLIL